MHLGAQNAVGMIAVIVRSVRTFLSILVLSGATTQLETAIGPRCVVIMDARMAVLSNVIAPRGVKVIQTPANAIGMTAPFVIFALRKNEGLYTNLAIMQSI